METLSIFHIKILQILAGRYDMSITLEELTSLLSPVFNSQTVFIDNMPTEKKNQVIVLDALLVLNDQGYVFLNSDTDKSCITVKGLIQINNKILCN
ncbi:hypothetical protein [Flavobacterium aquidurense]|uniref:hypothetical protein n=1 Tax=Flavobacterium aquidurense TaxID=362413 RepID=UPI0006D7D63D|nr:hypothetical protein [Flavobacterium aquidurense]